VTANLDHTIHFQHKLGSTEGGQSILKGVHQVDIWRENTMGLTYLLKKTERILF